MKRFITLLTLLFLSNIITAAPGCMDNSYRLTEPNDHKDYHNVSCNCPCENYPIIERKSICSKCRHYRDPRFRAMLIKNGPVMCPAAFTKFACTKQRCTDYACSKEACAIHTSCARQTIQ